MPEIRTGMIDYDIDLTTFDNESGMVEYSGETNNSSNWNMQINISDNRKVLQYFNGYTSVGDEVSINCYDSNDNLIGSKNWFTSHNRNISLSKIYDLTPDLYTFKIEVDGNGTVLNPKHSVILLIPHI